MSSKSTFSNSTAKSYALALYQLGKENDDLEKVKDGIIKIGNLIKDSSDFREMILSPTVTKEDKKMLYMLSQSKIIFLKFLKNFWVF